jgi:hypothetical protein
MRPVLLAVASLAAFVALGGADCSGIGECPCIPCTSAIHLKVLDDQLNTLNDGWTVEATLNGTPVADITNCEPGARFNNECTFGGETGLYRITVRDEGFQTRQIAARFSAKSGEDCCRCLTETVVTAILEPNP